jgi:hypothetical protein
MGAAENNTRDAFNATAATYDRYRMLLTGARRFTPRLSV